jgi:iron complex transport system substrate-binding protein
VTVGAIIALVAIAAAASVSSGAAARPPHVGPLRVMSINACADQYVLALLPPSQITSVSWLARDPSGSIMAPTAMKTPVNHGSVEEVLAQHPDLVIAGAYTTPATRLLLKRLRLPLLELQGSESFDDVRHETRIVAAALGVEPRGEALIARMDATLRLLEAKRPAKPLRVVAWDGGGFTAQPNSMYDLLLRTAGARNIGAGAVGRPSGAPGIETLLAAAPDLLVEGQPSSEPRGLRSDVLNSPIVRRFWGTRTVVLPTAYYACATPFSADGAQLLHDELQAAAARARQPLPFSVPGRP